MSQLITIALSLLGVVFALRRPLHGIILILAMVYFPIFSTFDLGPVSISISTLPVLALFLRAFTQWGRARKKIPIANWQWVILLSILAAYALATIASSDFTSSLTLLPNLIMYLMIVFSIIVLVRKPEDFFKIAKSILLMVLIDTISPGLTPIRNLLGTRGLGINGVVFKYYTAFSIGLVFITQQYPKVTKTWRLLGGLVAALVAVRAILFQTRSAWIALIVILVFLIVFLPRRTALIGLAVTGVIVSLIFWGDIIQENITESTGAVNAVQEDDFYTASEDDRIRLVSRDVGWNMFRDRPALGWGPNTFSTLIFRLATVSRKYVVGGAFNSWLKLMAEAGWINLIPVLAAFLSPLILFVFRYKRIPPAFRNLTLAFVMGLVGTVVHLLFIDLLYSSLVWLHLGLAMAMIEIAEKPAADLSLIAPTAPARLK